MMKRLALFLLLVAGMTLVAAVAQAANMGSTFTVTLKNGMTFETRYRPIQADWDPSISMIRTDQGNWIAIQNDEIADVSSELEQTGFGYQLDTTTVYLGWSPNDLVGEDEEGNEKANYEVGDIPESAIDNSIDQFLNINSLDAGATSAGVPLYTEVGGDG